MKFATDLGKGVLGEPDSQALWTEIIDHIPDEVLLNPGVKILSVACGHATESVILARRMLALGIPKKKVNDSIWLLDKYKTFTNHAQVVYGFQNVITADFLTWDTDMKFDVVIGNPPFQANSESGDRKQLSHNLYSKFVQKSIDLTIENGFVSMVIPTSWMTPIGEQSKSEKLEFKKNFKVYNLLALNINECSKHFNVGSTFSYFVLQKNLNKSATKVTCGYQETIYQSELILPETAPWIPNLLTNTSIGLIDKLMWDNRDYLPVKNDNFFHPVVNKTHRRTLSSEKQNNHVFPQYHTNAKILWSDVPHENQRLKKVLFSKSGYLKPCYDPGVHGTTDAGFWIEVASDTEGNNLINILNSKLYGFLTSINKWSGFNMPVVLQKLPNIDFKKSWTDNKIYKHFSLTQEEIELVESIVV